MFLYQQQIFVMSVEMHTNCTHKIDKNIDELHFDEFELKFQT